MFLIKESVLSLKTKQKHNIVFLLSSCLQVLKFFYDWPIVFDIFDDFGIWLLGYRIKFSCLYIPQVHYFISTL